MALGFGRFGKKTTTVPPVAAVAAAGRQKGLGARAAASVDNAAQGVYRRVARVSTWLFTGTMVAGLLKTVGEVKYIGKPFKLAEGVVRKPLDYMNNTTVSEGVHAPSTALKGISARLKRLANEPVVDATRVPEKSRVLVGAGVGTAGGSGRGMASGVSDVGITKPPKIPKHRPKLAQLSERFDGASRQMRVEENWIAGGVRSGVQKPFSWLADKVGDVKDGSLRMRLATRWTGKAGASHESALKALQELEAKSSGVIDLKGATEKVRGLLGDGTTALNAKQAEEVRTTLGGVQEALATAVKGKSLPKATAKGLHGILKKANTASEAQIGSMGRADAARNLSTAVKNVPNKLGDMSLANAAMKGALVAGTVVQVTSTTRGVVDSFQSLRKMHSDMTGGAKINPFQLMFSRNLPSKVKMARGQIWKNYGPRVVLNFLSTLSQYGVWKNNSKGSMLLTGGLMAAGQIHAAKAQSYTLLSLYDALDQIPEINAKQYAALISVASIDAAKAGGTESALVQAIAEQYAQEKTRPAQVMQEMESGKFDERAMDIVQANRAKMENSGGHTLAPANATNTREVDGAKLNERAMPNGQANSEKMKNSGSHKMAPGKSTNTHEVIGTHTQRVVQKERDAGLVGAGVR